jgi:hypothetical protein
MYFLFGHKTFWALVSIHFLALTQIAYYSLIKKNILALNSPKINTTTKTSTEFKEIGDVYTKFPKNSIKTFIKGLKVL